MNKTLAEARVFVDGLLASEPRHDSQLPGFIVRPHVDGLFIGRSGWTVEGYLEILARCAAAL